MRNKKKEKRATHINQTERINVLINDEKVLYDRKKALLHIKTNLFFTKIRTKKFYQNGFEFNIRNNAIIRCLHFPKIFQS